MRMRVGTDYFYIHAYNHTWEDVLLITNTHIIIGFGDNFGDNIRREKT